MTKKSKPFLFLDLDGPIIDVQFKYYGFYTNFLKSNGHNNLIEHQAYWQMKRSKTSNFDILKITKVDGLADDYNETFRFSIENMDYLSLDSLQLEANYFLTTIAESYRPVLVTMRRNKTTLLQQLQDMGILGHFHKVLCAADHPNPEPPYWMVKRDLMLTLKDQGPAVAIIGDTETDMRAGQAVGIHTIAVENGIRTRELLERENPTILVPGIHALSLDTINSLSCSALTLKL